MGTPGWACNNNNTGLETTCDERKEALTRVSTTGYGFRAYGERRRGGGVMVHYTHADRVGRLAVSFDQIFAWTLMIPWVGIFGSSRKLARFKGGKATWCLS